MNRTPLLLAGIAATITFSALWQVLWAGDRFASHAERIARRTLDYYELPQIQARIQRGPMHRRLILSGPADEFQHAELVRVLDQVPGVIDVRWDPASKPVPFRTKP